MADQQHPQYHKDRELLNRLMADAQADPLPDLVLVEVARLRIRYMGFPGARDIQQDLDQLLQRFQMSEEELFAQTRRIHQHKTIYQGSFSKRDDWA
ncbi:MAG: DUF3288 family protein [Cyanobacteriota bacterium]|nr:DUF3288 family protein [Cyanobacteriota bacterium]